MRLLLTVFGFLYFSSAAQALSQCELADEAFQKDGSIEFAQKALDICRTENLAICGGELLGDCGLTYAVAANGFANGVTLTPPEIRQSETCRQAADGGNALFATSAVVVCMEETKNLCAAMAEKIEDADQKAWTQTVCELTAELGGNLELTAEE